MSTLGEFLAEDENVSNIQEGEANVPIPELTKSDRFILLKVNEDADTMDVTLYQVSPDEAIHALLSIAQAVASA